MKLALLLSLALRLWMPYRDLCEKLHRAKFASLPETESDRLQPILRLVPDEGPPKPITLVIRAKAGDVTVEQAPDGATALPLRSDLFEENPPVLTSMPQVVLSAAPASADFVE